MKEIFIKFKEDVLSNFKEILMDLENNNFEEIFERRIPYIEDILFKNVNSETYESVLLAFKEKQRAILLKSLSSATEYIDFCREKFIREMNLLNKLLTSGEGVSIARKNYNLSSSTIKEIKERTGVSYWAALPAILFSANQQEEAKKVFREVFIFDKINSFEQLTENHLNIIRNNVMNDFSNSIDTEDFLNPIYREYFDSVLKIVGSEYDMRYFEVVDKEKICDLEFSLEKINEYEKKVFQEYDNILGNYEFGDSRINIFQIKSDNLVGKISLCTNGVSTIMPYYSEILSFYKVKVMEKENSVIDSRFIKNNEDINLFFEEYNMLDLLEYFVPYTEGMQKNSKFNNRYWCDREIEEKLKISQVFLNYSLDELSILFLKEKIFLITKDFKVYSDKSKNPNLEKYIDIFENELRSKILLFSSSDEALNGLLKSENGDIKIIENDIGYKIKKLYYEEKAKSEGKSLFNVILREDRIHYKEIYIEDLYLIFDKSKINWLLLKKNKELFFEDLGISLDYRTQRSGDLILIGINKNIVDISDDEKLSFLYETIIVEIVSLIESNKKINNEVINDLYNAMRKCLLDHQINMENKNKFEIIRGKKKI